MADYIQDTQKRSAMPDRSVVLSSYVKMKIDRLPQKEEEHKKHQLKEMEYLLGNIVHRNVDTEILIRDGSVIVEIIASGNLSELLSIENIEAMGISISDDNLLDISDAEENTYSSDFIKLAWAVLGYKTILNYATIRNSITVIIKDVKRVTAALSMFARSVFNARLGAIEQFEARTGILGNFQRFLDACDVARAISNSPKIRKESMQRVYFNLNKINDSVSNDNDIKLLSIYIYREIVRIKKIKPKDTLKAKEEKDVLEFNDTLKKCTDITNDLISRANNSE